MSKFVHIDNLESGIIERLNYDNIDDWGNPYCSWGLELTKKEFELLKYKGHLHFTGNSRSEHVSVAKTVLARLLANESEKAFEVINYHKRMLFFIGDTETGKTYLSSFLDKDKTIIFDELIYHREYITTQSVCENIITAYNNNKNHLIVLILNNKGTMWSYVNVLNDLGFKD